MTRVRANFASAWCAHCDLLLPDGRPCSNGRTYDIVPYINTSYPRRGSGIRRKKGGGFTEMLGRTERTNFSFRSCKNYVSPIRQSSGEYVYFYSELWIRLYMGVVGMWRYSSDDVVKRRST